jgi:hypothetical protein
MVLLGLGRLTAEAGLIVSLGFVVIPIASAQDGAESTEGATVELSPECAAFAADRYADLGDVLHAGCKPTLPQMSKLMDNPLGNVAMLFLQYDQYYVNIDDLDNESELQGNFMALLQFPKSLGKDWNLINRFVFNIPSVPLDQDKIDEGAPTDPPACPPAPGGGPPTCTPGALLPVNLYSGRTTGLGDSYYVGLFSPKETIDWGHGKFLWGAGFDVMLPTATEDVLGQGKWGAGPSALGLYMGPKLKAGALWQQYVSFAGSDNRDDVNMTNLQYFYMWSLNDTLTVGAAPNIIINWEADGSERFTVPVGLGMNKTMQFGKLPVRFGLELYYSVMRPNSVPSTEWNLRFYAIPAAPSALFGFMQ